ncbi:related to TRL1-tRNA ligase [Sporisorium reilianum SRZ2]|uniref:Related to TRL1-tRNA ligase n=1 Tax=Sporisorium reilianum (strain SRZ2) TaxID=999809 RepID=E6ZSQ5_SPORE|nr:related to TRL1-tRNA ligase [Sporisorium reilianum SRZ2]
MAANGIPLAGQTEAAPTDAIKVPNSPSTAFAALSLSDPSSSSSLSIFTPTHIAELDASTALVHALDEARKRPKPLIRSTGHIVPSNDGKNSDNHHLLSWKVAEFAYRKSTSVGSELPTLARGLFTERIASSSEKHRIAVRGYDKFFNLGEMAWTRPDAIARYTTAPYVLTFKENGCIIFVAALSPTELVVTSKHSLGSIAGTDVTHAQKGHEWLLRHLGSVGRTEQQLAHELWRRNETAAFELCDDAFEEHVLAYSPARSGLHLHGLNANSADLRTRAMPDVDAFAAHWGFIPTRWIELPTLEEVQRVTGEIEHTGAWEGEPIEGFVIRTHMPDAHAMAELQRDAESQLVRPPYAPGQAWFYKVKFDEPYLMYRDWRELARKMVKDKAEWESKVATLSSASDDTPEPTASSTPVPTEPDTRDEHNSTTEETSDAGPSKAALKRERKRLAKQNAKAAAASRTAAQAAGLLPPSPPQPRSKRPETALFITWCYDRLYGNAALNLKPQPQLFAGLAQNKGIIAMRNAFLAHLADTSPAAGTSSDTSQEEKDEREFTKTVITPIAVPGCGKTVLAIALAELFSVGHVQSDEFKKKAGFLAAVEKDLRAHAAERNYVLFADKNNHLLQHRDDMLELATRLSAPTPPLSKKAKQVPAVGRIRTIALAWDLDSVPLNTLHRVCAARIEQRGDNHQTLVADRDAASVSGLKTHEVVLWRFLEALQAFGSSEGKGEGAEGWGDAAFDVVVRLGVRASAEENLRTVVREVGRVVGWETPSEERVQAAMQRAEAWTVAKKATGGGEAAKQPRYFGLAVELDVRHLLDHLLLPLAPSPIAEFYTANRTRINQRPHITLVHHTALHADEPTARANRTWAFYAHLVSHQHQHAVFRVTVSTLLYEPGCLLTFPVDAVHAPEGVRRQFEELHAEGEEGEGWTPHITLATREDVRPFEANRVVNAWKSGEGAVQVVQLPQPLTVEARVFGMS